jgi:hypothetical protein
MFGRGGSGAIAGQLIGEQATPIVDRIVSSKIRGGTVEDVRSDVLADLISRLRELKSSRDRETIRDFRAYSAVVAYHGCDKYYRRAFPQRYRLENQLRYLLGKHAWRFGWLPRANGSAGTNPSAIISLW